MIIALLILGVIAIWAIYKAVVYALPCLLGLGAASVALDTGGGSVGAIFLALAIAILSHFLLRLLLENVSSARLRWVLAAVFALPSAVLAYNIGIDALSPHAPADFWRQTLSILFALLASTIAFRRMTDFQEHNS
ncbi:MAG: hypothetical protein R3C31_15100 [Hyphomonadaceae bacterium]